MKKIIKKILLNFFVQKENLIFGPLLFLMTHLLLTSDNLLHSENTAYSCKIKKIYIHIYIFFYFLNKIY